jgi:ATPase subunit of ABC transporter with duplicated ATPase domains
LIRIGLIGKTNAGKTTFFKPIVLTLNFVYGLPITTTLSSHKLWKWGCLKIGKSR